MESGLRWGKYRRISDDDEGRELGVKRQDVDLDAFIAERNPAAVFDYCDNDIGASTRSRKVRPAFRRIIADAKAGKIDMIAAYTSSRLTRRPREMEDLIELAEKAGIGFAYIRSPSFDLNTADGRMVARIMCSTDAAEAERTAERVSRKRLELAMSGRSLSTTRPFGWVDANGKLDRAEAKLTRAAVDYLLTGGYAAAVVTEWNEAGVLTSQGNTWRRSPLVQMLTAPRMAGLAVHKGEILPGVKVAWKPMLDLDTWHAVCDRLAGPERPRQPYRSYLLAGIVRCHCGVLMYGNPGRPGEHHYRCSAEIGGCGNQISGVTLDSLISDAIEADLAGQESQAPAAEWDGADELALAEQQWEELRAAYKAGTLPGSIAFPEMDERSQRIGALKRERRAATRTHVSTSEARTMWSSGEMHKRREVARTRYSAIVISPSSRGRASGPKFDYSRVVPIPAEQGS